MLVIRKPLGFVFIFPHTKYWEMFCEQVKSSMLGEAKHKLLEGTKLFLGLCLSILHIHQDKIKQH